jgi:hypothetical protein
MSQGARKSNDTTLKRRRSMGLVFTDKEHNQAMNTEAMSPEIL